METPDLVLCGKPSPGTTGLEPCCREKDHDGGCYWWMQAAWDDGSGIYGVQVFTDHDAHPKLLKSVYNMEFGGAVTAEEVCVVTTIFDMNRGRRKRPLPPDGE